MLSVKAIFKQFHFATLKTENLSVLYNRLSTSWKTHELHLVSALKTKFNTTELDP